MAWLTYENAGVAPDVVGAEFGVSDEQRASLEEALVEARRALSDAHESGELGFLDLPDADAGEIERWAAGKRQGRWTDAVVLGIGGSSLGARALRDAARPATLDGLELHVSENIDPESFGDLLDSLPLDTTLFVVVTKSGTTVETMGKFAVVFGRLVDELGAERAASQVVAVTSPDSGELRKLARRHDFETFSIPPNVGGRFSVLSPVGLVPLALAGYPIGDLLEGAAAARDRFLEASPEENAILTATADIYTLYQRGVAELVMMAYSDRLETLVDWFRQLWAESLGKAHNRSGEEVHTGMTPIKAVGTIDQHSQVQLYMEGPARRMVTFLGVDQFDTEVTIPQSDGLPEGLSHLADRSLGEVLEAELDGTQRALQEAGRPTTRWSFARLEARPVGSFLVAWETITALMGELLDIDAFDQPGVELGKKIAHGLLGDPANAAYADHGDEGAGSKLVVGA